MHKFKFAKLVRDKIVEHQRASGAIPTYRLLNSQEHKKELIKKIIEEAKEITNAKPNEVAAEIADVQQALDDLVKIYDLTRKDILHAQNTKKERNGTFEKGIFIEHVELESSDKWTAYYRENADRYPEIE